MSLVKKALGLLMGASVIGADRITPYVPKDSLYRADIYENPRFNGNTGRRLVKYRQYKKAKRAGFR